MGGLGQTKGRWVWFLLPSQTVWESSAFCSGCYFPSSMVKLFVKLPGWHSKPRWPGPRRSSARSPTAPLSVPGGLSHPLPPLLCMFPPPCIHFGLFPQPGVQCPQLNLAKAHPSNTTPLLSFQNSPCSSSAVYDLLGFIHSSMLSFTYLFVYSSSQ